MSMQRAWGVGCLALALGAGCSDPPRPPAYDGGILTDGARADGAADGATPDGATPDAATPDDAADGGPAGCALSPLVDLDRDGVLTTEGSAAWVDFSHAADARQIPTIPNCGGPVYNAALLQWTAPRAGIARLRVDRDQSDWSQELLGAAYLSARRVDRCAWDAPAHDCSVATFDTDAEHARSDFEFPVQAGTQFIALAWSFNYAGAGVRTTAVPALRVAMTMVDATGYGRACTAPTADREQLCPARSDCFSTGAATSCIPRGARGGTCRGPLGDCDAGLVCGTFNNTCDTPAAVGESCQTRGCAAGAGCVLRTPIADSRCAALGSQDANCRADGTCDAGLACRPVSGRSICVRETAAGATCDSTSYCAGGGVCAPSATGTSACAAPGAEGTGCGSSVGQPTPCAAGLRCIDQFCRRTRAATEPCENDRGCNAGLACIGNVCVEPTGARCTPRGDRCPDGQRCINQACVAVGAVGAACTGSNCAAGLTCASDTARCEVAPPTLGCVDDADCARGTACRVHVCVVAGQCPQRPAVGNVICDEGARCVPTSATAYACRPVGHDGGPCRVGAPGPCDAGFRCLGGVCLA
ncbi:MAG: hypothetical protein JWM10_3983, partial [Myxococcaceae bacterium]|nr:hypothetical protein [Myxococcaceae bacterium]